MVIAASRLTEIPACGTVGGVAGAKRFGTDGVGEWVPWSTGPSGSTDGGASGGGGLVVWPLDWFTEVELELLAVAEPVEIDADEDPDDDDTLAELEPVDAVAIMCTAEDADSARSRRVVRARGPGRSTRVDVRGPGALRRAGSDRRGRCRHDRRERRVGVRRPGSRRALRRRGLRAGDLIPGLGSLPVVRVLIHAAPATPSESDSARAPAPAATMRRRRCSRHVTAASMRPTIAVDGA